MATAEVLRITHSVDDNVKVLIDGVQSEFFWLYMQSLWSILPDDKQARLIAQQERFHKWLSPPDSSVNHNTACKAHHEGTATWFFQSSTFKKWKSTPSLLWIHGKRMFSLLSSTLNASQICIFIAGSGKSVLWFVASLLSLK